MLSLRVLGFLRFPIVFQLLSPGVRRETELHCRFGRGRHCDRWRAAPGYRRVSLIAETVTIYLASCSLPQSGYESPYGRITSGTRWLMRHFGGYRNAIACDVGRYCCLMRRLSLVPRTVGCATRAYFDTSQNRF